MAAFESSIASSMLTSMICAPFSTCWRATFSASREVATRIRRAKALEPVTLVRSPTFTNSESSPMLSGSSPDRRSFFSTSGSARGAHALHCLGDGADMCGSRAAAAADDVQETRPARIPRACPPCTPATRRIRPSRWAGRHWDAARCRCRRSLASSSMCGRRSLAPSAQFKPIDKRLGMRHGIPERSDGLTRQRAAGAIGDRAGDHDRQAHAAALAVLVDREQRRLGIQRVEDGLDQEQVDAAFDQRRRRPRDRPRPVRRS